ncbi:hypothetical protein GCM10010869_21330 [Mesorhizobium tianshanense]|nr:hypothetical protein GCM10010869_21330 [Mesorhizobium tianshanense]
MHEEFLLPADAPQWARNLIADRSVAGAAEAFWNKVEAFEKGVDAQLAKDLTVALPLELSVEQNIALVRDFVEKHVLSKGHGCRLGLPRQFGQSAYPPDDDAAAAHRRRLRAEEGS